jgi:hypothetical protein
MIPGWRTSWSISGRPPAHQTPTSGRRTGGGAQGLRAKLRGRRGRSPVSHQGTGAWAQRRRGQGGGASSSNRDGTKNKGSSRAPSHAEQGREPPEAPKGVEPPRAKKIKRRKLRKKVTRDNDHQWELVRQDAWLREMLTDSSGSETEEKYARFAESGRWVAEMTGIPQQTTTTSRGECSRQEKPGS